jgi:threonine dehydrogenase-like Zn-dependent dehydrogenase
LLFGDDIFHKELEIRGVKAMGPPPSLPPPNTQWGTWIPPRWTVDQSLEHVVHLMATKELNTKFIITHQFDYKDIINVYRKIDAGKMGKALQIILRW